MEFHHQGVVTDDAIALSNRLTEVLGVRECHVEQFAGMEVRFMAFEDGYFELLEPLGDSPLTGYLEDHGPGIHHVAFSTSDIEGRLERASEVGVELLDEEPRDGAWGHEIAFLHPRDLGGILVEYVAAEH